MCVRRGTVHGSPVYKYAFWIQVDAANRAMVPVSEQLSQMIRSESRSQIQSFLQQQCELILCAFMVEQIRNNLIVHSTNTPDTLAF